MAALCARPGNFESPPPVVWASPLTLERRAPCVECLFSAGPVWTSPATALEVGQKAPDFTLPGPGGKPVKLSDLTAKGPVVVFTFIQAFTNT